MPRVFIALELDDATRALAAEVALDLRRSLRGRARIGWTRPEEQHVTLAFLGEVPQAALEAVGEVVERVARLHAPMVVEAGGVGAFPRPEQARVLWLAFGRRGDALRPLVGVLEDGLRAAGHDLERREWSGHVTLARCRDREGLDAREALARCTDRRVDCPVEALVVMESRPSASGSRYAALSRSRLTA